MNSGHKAVWFGTDPRTIRAEDRPLLLYSSQPSNEMRSREHQVPPEIDPRESALHLIDFCKRWRRLHVCYSDFRTMLMR